ncbi:hypothetical protein E3N88_07294 [Mikania micrantha]|uniref:Uncharacterized protein n=1 Tax=Mikania micrantha TaxID=192012 RepID=A0A5N6PR76_9ASTR|nr:hypothetical protein E3N88_07294 [Mikania micrantha]
MPTQTQVQTQRKCNEQLQTLMQTGQILVVARENVPITWRSGAGRYLTRLGGSWSGFGLVQGDVSGLVGYEDWLEDIDKTLKLWLVDFLDCYGLDWGCPKWPASVEQEFCENGFGYCNRESSSSGWVIGYVISYSLGVYMLWSKLIEGIGWLGSFTLCHRFKVHVAAKGKGFLGCSANARI